MGKSPNPNPKNTNFQLKSPIGNFITNWWFPLLVLYSSFNSERVHPKMTWGSGNSLVWQYKGGWPVTGACPSLRSVLKVIFPVTWYLSKWWKVHGQGSPYWIVDELIYWLIVNESPLWDMVLQSQQTFSLTSLHNFFLFILFFLFIYFFFFLLFKTNLNHVL